MRERVIYDFGANVGLNLPYYLQKADKVIAVEANTTLAEGIKSAFAQEVARRRLVVVDKAVTASSRSDDNINFFVYSGSKAMGHVLSSLEAPAPGKIESFEQRTVVATDAHELFNM